MIEPIGDGPKSELVSEGEWLQFPGARLIRAGLADVSRGAISQDALAVLVAKPRLIGIGFHFEDDWLAVLNPEDGLYNMLCEAHGDEANAAFNAIRQELVSFANAFDQAISKR